MTPENFGVYIHIPFCRTKCNYCSFVIRPWDEDLAERYSRAVVKELTTFFSKRASQGSADSIFLGGGTPSLVPGRQITEILAACRDLFEVSPDSELTLEANPGTLTDANTAAYVEAGINRVSLGAQTFNDVELASIGRDHTAEDIEKSVRVLRKQGITNINLDLIVGLPGQTSEQWSENLNRVADLRPTHVSVYMLELEEKSALFQLRLKGRVQLPGEDWVSETFVETRDRLLGQGFYHYEISNFAREGYESRHNLKYWRRQPVLGFGLGSHSFDGDSRYANHARIDRYLRLVEQGLMPIEWRRPPQQDEDLAEKLFLGLRLQEGVDWRSIAQLSGRDRFSRYESSLRRMREDGLLEWDDSTLRLTTRGMLLSNEVFQEFL